MDGQAKAGTQPPIVAMLNHAAHHSPYYRDQEWASRLSEILQLRKAWKAEGKGMKEVVEHSERHIAEKKWLAS